MAVTMRHVSVVNSCIAAMAAHLVGATNGGLAISKHCGDVECSRYEYCNSDNMCDACTKICEVDSYNHESDNCERNCQDYIHDHINSYVNASTFAQLKGTVESLQSLVVTSLSLSVFLILVIGIILLVAWYRYRQLLSSSDVTIAKSKEFKKKMASVKVISNNNDSTPDTRLSLKIPPPVPESEQGCPQSAITTTTPLSTRHPSEDNTLEYAYDNPALTPSPGTNLRRTETTF